jgi:hypothetical protein
MVSEFLYHLHDTVILLGLEKRFADLLNRLDRIDEADIEELQRYNGRLLDATKDKLLGINRITVVRGDSDDVPAPC